MSFGEIIRNTPILVQLLWVYYVLPIVFGVGIEALAALIIGLSVYQAAFISEVYRSGIQSVPKGHREAAQVLGLTPVQSFRRIVLPQAIRMTLPPLASNFVQLIKFSSLGAVISVSEITRRGMELSRHQLPAARDLHLHRRGLLLHLLAARDGASAGGNAACRTADAMAALRARALPARSTPRSTALIADDAGAGRGGLAQPAERHDDGRRRSPKRCCARSPASRSSASSRSRGIVSLVGRIAGARARAAG